MTTRSDYYTTTSQAFLAQAEASLAEGDLLQASEKGWGAAAEMVKGLSETRGWRHQSHGLLYQNIDLLSEQNNDPDLLALFGNASALHINYYEGWMTRAAVAVNLGKVRQLLTKLESLPA